MKEILCVAALITCVAASSHAARSTISLSGEIADSIEADAIPAAFEHRVMVPGLVNQL
jgi:hypothetical protein